MVSIGAGTQEPRSCCWLLVPGLLLSAAAAQAQEVLGGWLVREGLIAPQDLTAALARQGQMIVDRMFGSLDAVWQFEEGVRMVDSVDVKLNVIQLLLESARASDESHARATLDLKLPLARAS
mgnify:CR=1 FL=1